MLCSSCRRQLSSGAPCCTYCGRPLPGAAAPLDLVLADLTRVPIAGELVIGRAPGSTLQLDDPTVSRMHARIATDRNGAPYIEDVGSSHGTYLDGVVLDEPRTLRDGARIQIGQQVLSVELRRDAAEAGRTIVVRPGATLMVSSVGAAGAPVAQATQFGIKPRVRSGYALKRLDEEEGGKRYVLRDLRSGKFLRLSERDAEVFQLLDGSHTLIDIISFAEMRWGGAGAPRVARLLADLGERGFLAGIASASAQGEKPPGFFKRMIGPHEKAVRDLGPFFTRLYERAGWLLFTRPALWVVGLISLIGIAAFGYLVGGRYGTPFVVASKIGIGGLIFLAGRFLVVAIHETAHGLTMASYGRSVDRAGLKFVFVIPYAFVDTSEAWFEPRRRRIAISAAGPASDLALGGAFAICSLAFSGTVREVFFQLAFAAYIGAFFNLNPFLDRDGYQMLVDILREPGLRRRARDQFERRLSGRGRSTDSPVLGRYSVAGLVWGVLAIGFAVYMSLRYEPIMVRYAPETVVHVVLATLWVALFIPVVWVIVKPLFQRLRRHEPAAVG